MLAENLQTVQKNIAQALTRRREPKCTGTEEVLLVAVTKNHPASVVTDIQNPAGHAGGGEPGPGSPG
jgi:uncharacterized pyridoxal phosphate-containing UPF0001 family protein